MRVAFLHLAIGSLLLCFLALPAYGASLAEDDFDGDGVAGDNLNGKNGGAGFTAPWSTSGAHVTLQTKTLNPPIGPSGTSLAARIQPTADVGNDDSVMNRPFTPTSSTVYLGMTVRVESLESGDFINFQLSDGDVGNTAETLGFGISNDANNSFFARIGTSGNTTTSSVSATDDTDFRVVAKLSIDGGTEFNRVDLFIDPTGTDELSQTIAATQLGPSSGLTMLSLFNIRVNSFESSDLLFMDNLFISDTFAEAVLGEVEVEVVPEPSGMAIWAVLGAVAGAFCILRRRRQG